MNRRVAWPVLAVVGLVALSPSLIRSAAAQAPAPGTMTTVAGTGEGGFSGDGRRATQARLNIPMGVAVDTAGNLFITEERTAR